MFEFTDQLWHFVKKYFFPIVLLIVGLFITIVALKVDPETNMKQGEKVLYGGLCIIGMSIISGLYIIGLINRMVHMVMIGVLAVVSLGFMYMDYDSIASHLAMEEKKEKVEIAVKQRLTDIRDAQVAYRAKYNRFCPNFEELIEFIKHDEIPIPFKKGLPPDRPMTRAEADSLRIPQDQDPPETWTIEQTWILAQQPNCAADLKGFVRDTTYVAAMKHIFTNPGAKATRDYPFHVDSLAYIPFAKLQDGKRKTFIMKTDSIQNLQGAFISVFMCTDTMRFDPFTESLEPYMVGSLDQNTTNGNW
jgi:hypothetical protein